MADLVRAECRGPQFVRAPKLERAIYYQKRDGAKHVIYRASK